MSDIVFQAIAKAPLGYVEAAAGCGKTEAIVRAVGDYCTGTQLVLTHTHAGVGALRQRFKKHKVSREKYHIDTIASWAWRWVRKYPENASYEGAVEFAEWSNVYAAMANLLEKDFVTRGILNSYAGVIVDEYQDCTVQMHALISKLSTLLPCRILGDELQGIFELGNESLVKWPDVRSTFRNNLGALHTPYRWEKAGNRDLGNWLINARLTFKAGAEPDLTGSPVERAAVSAAELGARLVSLTHKKQGRICVIRSKSHPLPKAIETTLVNKSYHLLEANELPTLRDLIRVYVGGASKEQSEASIKFLKSAFGGVPPDVKKFVQRLLRGESLRPMNADRRQLASDHRSGATPHALLAVLRYLEKQNQVACKLRDSVSVLKCILEEHVETSISLTTLFTEEIARRKHFSRGSEFRCVGSTLLVKGLEFENAIIVKGNKWGTAKDLYVALTRGSKSVTVLDVTGAK